MCWHFWRPYIKCGRVLACQRCCHKLKGFRTRKWRKGHDENKLCIRKTNFFGAYMQYASHAPRTTHNSIIFKSFQEEVLPNSISCTWRHIRLVVWSRIFQTHTHTHTTHTTHTHTQNSFDLCWSIFCLRNTQFQWMKRHLYRFTTTTTTRKWKYFNENDCRNFWPVFFFFFCCSVGEQLNEFLDIQTEKKRWLMIIHHEYLSN